MKKVAIILDDIKKLAVNASMNLLQIEELIDNLSYTPFKQYLLCLKVGVKPEDATAILLKHFVEDVFEKTPFVEMRIRSALGDTALQETVHQPVMLIAKPLFKVIRDEKGQISGLKPDVLQYENYKSAINAYLNDNAYVIVTNFSEVLIFDKDAQFEFEPLQTLSFIDMTMISKDKDTLFSIAQSFQKPTNQEVVLKQFTKTIERLAEEKNVISVLFCKFIEAYQLVHYQFLNQLFSEHKRTWEGQGENFIFEKFTNTLNEWLVAHYRLAIPNDNPLDFLLFEKLFLTKSEKVKNLSDYNYRKINEYTLGKAFENLYKTNNDFQEEIYDRLCESLIRQLFENQITKITENIGKRNLKKAKQLFEELQKKAITNPFVDSGIIFSKLLKLIFGQYQQIEIQIDAMLNEKQDLLDRDDSWNKLALLKEELGFNNSRKFIVDIIKNQLFIDLSETPNTQLLAIAKLNTYIAAISLAPTAFAFRKPAPQEEREAFEKFDTFFEPPLTFTSLACIIPLASWKKESKALINKILSQVAANNFFCLALPADLLFGGAETALRQLLLVENTAIEILTFEQGKTAWALLTVQKKKFEKNDTFRIKHGQNAQKEEINYANSLISGFSPELFNIIKFDESIDYQICSKLRAKNITIYESGYTFKNEFKLSNDTNFFLRSAEENTLPLYEGRAVDSYTLSDEIKYFIPKEKAHSQLLSKEINTLKKTLALSQKNYEIVGIFNEKEFLLDYQCERLVIRKLPFGEFSLYSCALIPVNSFAESSLLYLSNFQYEKTGKDLIQRVLPKEDKLFLLALLNSWVLNFYLKAIGLADIGFLPFPKIKNEKSRTLLKGEIAEKASQILHLQDDNAVSRLVLESQIAKELYGLDNNEFAHVCKIFQT